MEELAGRTAVITGAGSGMGKAFALRFAAEGMAIVAADIQPDALAATVAELTPLGHQVVGVATDVADPDSVLRLADAAYERFGAVHLLCNNAGVEGYLDGPIWAATSKDWEWTVGVNFWSVVHGIREFVPRMLAAGEPGHVVNTCSMTAVVSAGNMYAITKHAVLALTEVLALDLARRNASIGVTALCPGIIATNLFRGSRNRPARLREDDAFAGLSQDRDAAAGDETRERMHATLAAGMPPAEVAAKLVDAVRTGTRYLLTDHDWDPRIQERHESIMGGAAGPLTPASLGGLAAAVSPVRQAGAPEEIVSQSPQAGAPEEVIFEGQHTNGAADG
jgi:NAD(P)-dependent dehydrogenase (short-subunit alcohol dehydrogenase family)